MKRYLPFTSGVYTTAPGLARGEGNFFDVDEQYQKYIDNKNRCRSEDITKYHCVSNFKETTAQAVNNFLSSRMKAEHPGFFDFNYERYLSPFDALCSQLQEDLAVVQIDRDKDWLAAIHLCSPNHWDPRTKIARPFNEIHAPIPHIERTVKNYQVMLKMIVDKEPFTRFAWGISTDTRLNHHPEPPPGVDAEEWGGRRVADDNTEFFVRVEKQNLIGLKEVNAFIFTIRTYFYPISELSTDEKNGLSKAVGSMSEESLEYKGMKMMKDSLIQRLL